MGNLSFAKACTGNVQYQCVHTSSRLHDIDNIQSTVLIKWKEVYTDNIPSTNTYT